MEPLVSIIMNCHNGDTFLKDAIDSVYKQDYKNWEIIFWDNASTDNSAIIAKSYDERLKYYKLDRKVNLGKARLLAIEKAKGSIFAFIDTDDLWKKDKLRKQVSIMNNNKIDLVFSRAEIISSDNSVIRYCPDDDIKENVTYVFDELVKRNFIPFVSAALTRKAYYDCGGFPELYKNSTDYALILKVSSKYQVHYTRSVLCSYRVHDNNLSSRQKVISCYECIDVASQYLPSQSAVLGLQYHYSNLLISSISELNIKALLWVIPRLRRIDILLIKIFYWIKHAVSK